MFGSVDQPNRSAKRAPLKLSFQFDVGTLRSAKPLLGQLAFSDVLDLTPSLGTHHLQRRFFIRRT